MDALGREPCREDRPWSLIISFDEYSPGNALSPNNKRKCMNLNFSFTQLRSGLRSDKCWATPLTLRHNIAAEIPGGYSRVFATYMRRHLLGTHGCSVVGVPLDCTSVGGGVRCLWAVLTNIAADGEGFELGFEWKGASSLRPCVKHWNVLKKGSDLAARDASGVFVEIGCPDSATFKEWTHAELIGNCEEILEARARRDDGSLTASAWDRFCTLSNFNCKHRCPLSSCVRALGLTAPCSKNAQRGQAASLYTPWGLLACRRLSERCDWARCITLDWMHTFLQNGVLTDEVWAVMQRSGVELEEVRTFLKQPWCHPSCVPKSSTRSWEVFNPKRSPETKIKASASELLSLYSLLRYFLETKPREAFEPEMKSFDAVCAVIDEILDAKQALASARMSALEQQAEAARRGESLQRKMELFMRLHQAAYGEQMLKPKHHWAMDIGGQVRRDHTVLDCFGTERLHLRTKRVANNVKDASKQGGWEAKVLGGMLAQHLQELKAADGLQGRVHWLAEMQVYHACSATEGGIAVSQNDVVFDSSTGEMGIVVTCAATSLEGTCFVIAEPCEHLQRLSPHASRWRVLAGQVQTIPLHRLKFPKAWQVTDEGTCLLVVV